MVVSTHPSIRSSPYRWLSFVVQKASAKQKFADIKTHNAVGKHFNAGERLASQNVKTASGCAGVSVPLLRLSSYFSIIPTSAGRADQTQRLRKSLALGWVLGLSLRGVMTFLSAVGVTISHMTVWWCLQEQAALPEK